MKLPDIMSTGSTHDLQTNSPEAATWCERNTGVCFVLMYRIVGNKSRGIGLSDRDAHKHKGDSQGLTNEALQGLTEAANVKPVVSWLQAPCYHTTQQKTNKVLQE